MCQDIRKLSLYYKVVHDFSEVFLQLKVSNMPCWLDNIIFLNDQWNLMRNHGTSQIIYVLNIFLACRLDVTGRPTVWLIKCDDPQDPRNPGQHRYVVLAIWWHRSGSTLAWVRAWCLTVFCYIHLRTISQEVLNLIHNICSKIKL